MRARRKNPACDLNGRYPIYFERATVITLLCVIALFIVFKKFDLEQKEEAPSFVMSVVVDEVPATRQGARRPPPKKPSVPVPAESESFPEDETIDPYWIEHGSGQRASTGDLDNLGGQLLYLPRAIRDVIPEYPEKLRGKVRGLVRLLLQVNKNGAVDRVLVVENTTGSSVLEKAAVEAARKCLFWPPRNSRGQAVTIWVPKLYRFE